LHRHDPAAAVVTLLGEHDAQSAGRLEGELAVLLDDGVNLVVDLSEATFLDYHALSVLLSARYRAEEEQLGFVLVLPENHDTQVHRTLEITGLESAFVLSATVDHALTASRAGRTAGRLSLR
jgi:anti-anti-sigma factor